MKAVTLLKKALTLLSKKERWKKGSMADDAKGNPVPANARSARCFCAVGAVTRYAGDLRDSLAFMEFDAALAALDDALPNKRWGDIVTYNDSKRTTHEQILSVFRRAIKKLEAA